MDILLWLFRILLHITYFIVLRISYYNFEKLNNNITFTCYKHVQLKCNENLNSLNINEPHRLKLVNATSNHHVPFDQSCQAQYPPPYVHLSVWSKRWTRLLSSFAERRIPGKQAYDITVEDVSYVNSWFLSARGCRGSDVILCPLIKVAPDTDDRYYTGYILEQRFEARCTSGQLRLAGRGGSLGCSEPKFRGS